MTLTDLEEVFENIMNFRIIEKGCKDENDFIIHICMEMLGKPFSEESEADL